MDEQRSLVELKGVASVVTSSGGVRIRGRRSVRRAAAREDMQLTRAGKAQEPGDEASGYSLTQNRGQSGGWWSGMRRKDERCCEREWSSPVPSVAWRSKCR